MSTRHLSAPVTSMKQVQVTRSQNQVSWSWCTCPPELESNLLNMCICRSIAIFCMILRKQTKVDNVTHEKHKVCPMGLHWGSGGSVQDHYYEHSFLVPPCQHGKCQNEVILGRVQHSLHLACQSDSRRPEKGESVAFHIHAQTSRAMMSPLLLFFFFLLHNHMICSRLRRVAVFTPL